MMKETKHIGTFAGHDANGNEYAVYVYQDFNTIRTSSGTSCVPGLKTMRTDDGEHVNFVSKGKYEVLTVLGKVPITSDDPNAPE